MSDEERTTLAELEKRAHEEARDAWEYVREHSEFGNVEDFIDETSRDIANSGTPVYISELLEVALSDLWLAVEECEIPAFDGKNTAVNIIAGNIYEHIREIAREELERLSQEEKENGS